MGLKFNKTLSQTLWTGLRGQISAYSKKNTNLLPCSAASPRQSLGWLGCWSGCKPIFRYFNPRAKLKHLAPLMAYCLHFQETHNSQHLPTKKRTQKSDSVAYPEYQDRDHNPFRVKIETWSIFTNLTRALAVDYCQLLYLPFSGQIQQTLGQGLEERSASVPSSYSILYVLL